MNAGCDEESGGSGLAGILSLDRFVLLFVYETCVTLFALCLNNVAYV